MASQKSISELKSRVQRDTSQVERLRRELGGAPASVEPYRYAYEQAARSRNAEQIRDAKARYDEALRAEQSYASKLESIRAIEERIRKVEGQIVTQETVVAGGAGAEKILQERREKAGIQNAEDRRRRYAETTAILDKNPDLVVDVRAAEKAEYERAVAGASRAVGPTSKVSEETLRRIETDIRRQERQPIADSYREVIEAKQKGIKVTDAGAPYTPGTVLFEDRPRPNIPLEGSIAAIPRFDIIAPEKKEYTDKELAVETGKNIYYKAAALSMSVTKGFAKTGSGIIDPMGIGRKVLPEKVTKAFYPDKNKIIDPDQATTVGALGIAAAFQFAPAWLSTTADVGFIGYGSSQIRGGVRARDPSQIATGVLYAAPAGYALLRGATRGLAAEIDNPVFTKDFLASKSGSFRGGRSRTPKKTLRERKPTSKAELRKRSLQQAYDPRVTYSQGEFIGRVRSKALKNQFIKERVIRKEPFTGKTTEIKDVGTTRDPVTGGRSTLKTNYVTGASSKGAPSTPRMSKLYPKDYGVLARRNQPTEVLSAKAGQKSLQVFKMRDASFEVLKREPIRKKPFSGPRQATITTRPTQKTPLVQPIRVKRVPVFKESPKGGFRQGQREKLFARLRAKKQELDFIRSKQKPPEQSIITRTTSTPSARSTNRLGVKDKTLGQSIFDKLGIGKKRKSPFKFYEETQYFGDSSKLVSVADRMKLTIDLVPVRMNGKTVFLSRQAAGSIRSTRPTSITAGQRSIGVTTPRAASGLVQRGMSVSGLIAANRISSVMARPELASVQRADTMNFLDVLQAQRLEAIQVQQQAQASLLDTATIQAQSLMTAQKLKSATKTATILAMDYAPATSINLSRITNTPRRPTGPRDNMYRPNDPFRPTRPRPPNIKRPEIKIPRLKLPSGGITPRGIGGGTKTTSQAYAAYVKRRGRYMRVTKQPLIKSDAEDVGARVALDTLAATFKVRKVKGVARDIPTGNEFMRNRNKFRSYQVKNGRQVPLPENTYIQRRRTRLGSIGELGEIRQAASFAPRRSRSIGRASIL